MAFDPSMNDLFPDTITISPFSSNSVTQVLTHGSAVSHRAQVTSEWSKTINKEGREVESTIVVLIPERVHIDPRDLLTLPAGWVPNTPPIISVRPVGGVASISLDSTEIRA